LRRLSSDLYDEAKSWIWDLDLRQAIDLAEEAVLADPSPPPVRPDRTEIDGIIYDWATPGVMLAYEIDGDGVRFLQYRVLFRP